MDIYENENELVLTAEIPGIDEKDIEIKIEDNTLTLKGERKFEKETKEENYHRIERSYGSFYRAFTLPNSVDTDKIQAEHENGVLKIIHAEARRSSSPGRSRSSRPTTRKRPRSEPCASEGNASSQAWATVTARTSFAPAAARIGRAFPERRSRGVDVIDEQHDPPRDRAPDGPSGRRPGRSSNAPPCSSEVCGGAFRIFRKTRVSTGIPASRPISRASTADWLNPLSRGPPDMERNGNDQVHAVPERLVFLQRLVNEAGQDRVRAACISCT